LLLMALGFQRRRACCARRPGSSLNAPQQNADALEGEKTKLVVPNMQAFSETLFEELCSSHGISCETLPTSTVRTPDFAITLRSVRVICEVKQINPNFEDLQEIRNVHLSHATGPFVPNRLRAKLKNVSGQLKAASVAGSPTMLVVYDNTPFKMYTDHFDVVQAMFGAHTVAVSEGRGLDPIVSEPFFGGNRGLTPNQNTALSALTILDGGPTSEQRLRVYHNPYAAVVLQPELLEVLPVVQRLLPGETTVNL
jgi:hypothetical protein